MACDEAHSIDPSENMTRANMRRTGRPKMLEIEARKGMVTDCARRYDVPIQMPWVVVVPLRSSTMVWQTLVLSVHPPTKDKATGTYT